MRKIVNLTVLLDGCCLLQLPLFFSSISFVLFGIRFIRLLCVSRCFITGIVLLCVAVFAYYFPFGFWFLLCARTVFLSSRTQFYAVLFSVFRIYTNCCRLFFHFTCNYTVISTHFVDLPLFFLYSFFLLPLGVCVCVLLLQSQKLQNNVK